MFRVLVVDDDPDINEALRQSLKLAGYEVVGVLDGESALAEVKRRCPDLILLDQMLPDIDGVEVCRRVRATPETRRVPIVFVSARAGEASRVSGLALGADDYIVKPFSMPELLLRVRAILRRATPIEVRLPPEWVQLREQYRLRMGYADIHFGRGEWRECMEVCRNTLSSCDSVLSSVERSRIYERLASCAEALGDTQSVQSWQSLARSTA